MTHDSADLFVQQANVVGKEMRLQDALYRLPGVRSVTLLSGSDEALEARVHVEFDPQETNPILMKEALARDGFTVLSTGERPAAGRSAEDPLPL